MTVTIPRLLVEPDLYFHSFDNEFARFVQMDREHFSRSIFMDRRIVRPDDVVMRVPLDALMPAFLDRGIAPPRLNFIHHVAQCGSTLLARALDLVGRTRVIREPFHLRDLGVQAGVRREHDGQRHEMWRDLVDFSLAQLSKRAPGETVIVKGNVPISMLAPYIDSVDHQQAGILLYFPFDDYLAAVLRTPGHGQWVESVVGELGLERDPLFADLGFASTPLKAAALWLALMLRFAEVQRQNPRMASLDANRLFEQPAATIAASAQHFDVPLAEGEAETIAASALFSTYGKNPDQPYDPAQRVARREATKAELAGAMAEARAWIAPRIAQGGLGDRLANPLVADAPTLF